MSKLCESPKIGVTLNVKDLPLSSAESKATYEKIRYYVENKYGFTVPNLYIAQVKRDFGLIEHENYRKGSGDNPVPQCPKEKRDAIIDALKYFQMIPEKE